VTFATLPPPATQTASTASTAAPPAATTAPATAPESSTTAAPATEPTATVAPTAPATPPAPAGGRPRIALQEVARFDQPLDLAWRAGDPAAYVVEQGGRVRPLRDGVAGEPVLDVTDLTDAAGEQGLLGLAFSPDGTRGYVHHTDLDGDTDIVEYAVDADGTFDPASRRVLLEIDQPFSNHNGGNLMIGPDGLLYVGMGDGGSQRDPDRRALDASDLLGKILRIDPTPSGGLPYTVPPDNPFTSVAGARPEIWSVGVRNPWRMSFDPVTGDMWFGDVGQGDLEEIDVAWAAGGRDAGRGLNFGWSAFEGTQRFNDDQSPDGATPPIHEYVHGDAGCSVSGGAVYRGTAVPGLAGWYVYGDYCSGALTGLRVVDRVLVDVVALGELGSVGAIRAGPDGELYAISLDGAVTRLTAA